MHYQIWKKSLVVVFLIVLIHFLKDITQDILGIPSILDRFGNINENINYFPDWLTWLYHWAWVNALIVEFALIVVIPLKIKEQKRSKKDTFIVIGLTYILAMTLIAYLLQ